MKKKSKVLSALLALVMVFTILLVPNVEPTKADGGMMIKYKSSIAITTGMPYVYVDLGKKWNQKKTLKVVSSNKSVVAVENKNYPSLYLKKAGTATVKFKTGGKTYAMKFRVVKYKNPVKAFKVGGKSVAGQFKKYNMGELTYKKDKAKVVIKPNSGWVVKKIKYSAYKYDPETDKVKTYSKAVKNKGTFKLKGSSWNGYLVVTLYNKSKNVKENLELYIDRG